MSVDYNRQNQLSSVDWARDSGKDLDVETLAEYVLRTKTRLLGDRHASDRALAEHWGVSTSSVSNARYNECTDPIALRIAEALKIPAGEVLWAARTAREKDPETKKHLERWARDVGKILASVPKKAASAFVAAVVLGMFQPAHDAQAGGAGGLR
jgi:hypothetical protein